jgi:C1A family cysteine protease
MPHRASSLPFHITENCPLAGFVLPIRRLFPVIGTVCLAWLLAGCSSNSLNQVIFTNTTDWHAQFTLLQQPADGAQDFQTTVESLQTQGLQPVLGHALDTPQGKAQLLTLSGTGGADQLRGLMFGELGVSLNPLGAQTSLTLQGAIHTGQALTFTFETNPTTGYSWQAEDYDQSWIRQDGEPRFNPRGNGIGAPAQQIVQFTALRDGVGTMRWVYRRPWEAEDKSIERALSIQAPELDTVADLSNPLSVSNVFTLPFSQDVPVPNIETQSNLVLPVSFDWRTHTTISPVRNQGQCGSCWAFATVGVLESAMSIHYGFAPDLSEQYLVSCNTSGWGCGGGFTAHDFHMETPGKDESTPGAVLESSFPYSGYDPLHPNQDLACKGPYEHPVQIQSWSYVGDYPSYPTKPPAQQIKQAILQHGPVETMVCAGSRWGSYGGGIFSTDESSSCSGSVNHAVDLVGWNDQMLDVKNVVHKVWIVRNSWGSGWGDHGYMLIDQGISNIGYGTSFVSYDGSSDLSAQSDACPATKILACGDQVEGQNNQAGSTKLISSYACSANRNESGPEVSYQFSSTYTGKVTASLDVHPVNAQVDPTIPDLDIFALNAQGSDCKTKDCVAFGDQQVTFDVKAGQPVYLNVDGNSGAVGRYTLSVSCAITPQAPGTGLALFLPLVTH